MNADPLVSVYWISAYRSDFLLESVVSFQSSTSYTNIEKIVVDCSVGDEGIRHRQSIQDSGKFNKLVFRDSVYCTWSNANEALRYTKGEYIVQLEDDTKFRMELVPKDWLAKAISRFEENQRLGAINLFSGSVLEPMSMGFISPRWVRERWGEWDCFPARYKTISESQRYGDRSRLNRFLEMGFECEGEDYLLTSFTAPSINPIKLQDKLGLTDEDADALIRRGTKVIRSDTAKYVTFEEYRNNGGYEGYSLRAVSDNGEKLILIGKTRAFLHRIIFNLRKFTFQTKKRIRRQT